VLTVTMLPAGIMVVIVTRLPAGHPRNRSSISDKERIFSLRQNVQVNYGAYPAYCLVGTPC
jgi:hypothetical protein